MKLPDEHIICHGAGLHEVLARLKAERRFVLMVSRGKTPAEWIVTVEGNESQPELIPPEDETRTTQA